MTEYNRLERMIARALERTPRLRHAAKTTYQWTNYQLYGDNDFKWKISSGITLQSPIDRGNRGQKAVFFGYYDKSPWNPQMTQAVFHKIDNNKDTASIIVCRVQDENDIQTVASTSAWNFQQGSMLQWRPETAGREIIFNDILDGQLVSRILNLDDYNERTLTTPIQTVHPSGDVALCLNYRRLDRFRPQYGYGQVVSNYSSDQPLTDDGLWMIDLNDESTILLVSLAELTDHAPRPSMDGATHAVNHAMYSPNGSRFVFMHRWKSDGRRYSRLYVADSEGSEFQLLMDDDTVSHYDWRSEDELVVWGRGEDGDQYYTIDVTTGNRRRINALASYGDGHPSVSPDGRWLITDTYPDKRRQRRLVLYDFTAESVLEVGRFFEPWEFRGSRRCDLHPRWSPDGTTISIDSACDGTRQTYFLNISNLVEGDRKREIREPCHR